MAFCYGQYSKVRALVKIQVIDISAACAKLLHMGEDEFRIVRVEKKRATVVLHLQNGSSVSLLWSVYQRHAAGLATTRISRRSLQDLIAENTFQQGYDAACRYLARRARTAEEVRRYLANKQFDRETVASVLQALEQKGYLNDMELARSMIAQWKKRLKGPRYMAYQLTGKGVAREQASELVRALYTRQEEADILRRLATQKAAAWADMDPRKRRQKLYRFLTGRGFTQSMIMDALADCCGDG